MNIEKVLVPVDFSESSKAAVEEADALAADRGASITLLHVHQPTEVVVMDFAYSDPPEKVAEVCDAAEAQLNEWSEPLKTPPERRSIQVVTGAPVTEINRISGDYDLVVMPTHGRTGLRHFLLGSVAERVVQGAKCSVLVIKSEDNEDKDPPL